MADVSQGIQLMEEKGPIQKKTFTRLNQIYNED